MNFDDYEIIQFEDELIEIQHTWDIFSKNGYAIYLDFDLLTVNRKSQPIPSSVNVMAPENVFIEEGAKIQFSTLNASNGPIYIGKDAEIMEGSLIRGPFALCEKASIKNGSKNLWTNYCRTVLQSWWRS